jgi:hypothetical protein
MYELGNPVIRPTTAVSLWRKASEVKPTKEDANGNGCILAIHKEFGCVDEWQYSTVADNPENFYCWYPLLEPPEEFMK